MWNRSCKICGIVVRCRFLQSLTYVF
jgi:hypothetical protein